MMSLCATPWFRRLSTLALASSLVLVSTATAQTSAVTASPSGPRELHIVIIEGEDALNNIRERTAREPIVKVEDENHKPVAGVLILFAAHGSGSSAGATFAGATTLSVHTDSLGQAVATGFHPNAIGGKYQIDVTATLGSLTTAAIIEEQNVTGESTDQTSSATPAVVKPKHHIGAKTLLIGGAVAVGVVLAVILTRSSGATITAGAGGVGHP